MKRPPSRSSVSELIETTVKIRYDSMPTHRKDISYPMHEDLLRKIELALELPLWRIHVRRKGELGEKERPLNIITLIGIDGVHQRPKIDAHDLSQTILGICYLDAYRRRVPTTYLIRCMLRKASKRGRMEITMHLDPGDLHEDPGPIHTDLPEEKPLHTFDTPFFPQVGMLRPNVIAEAQDMRMAARKYRAVAVKLDEAADLLQDIR